MSRPAPWRLSPDSYPKLEVKQTRFQDLDTMGHLNNVAYAALFEDARVRTNQQLGRVNRGKMAEGTFRAVVAQNVINYLAEGSFPEDVEIALGIGRIGNRSFEMLAAMFQSGKCIATCDTTIVMTDPKGESLPAEFVTRLEGMRVKGDLQG
ncbi:acyl-CoA thioesterase [Sphingomonas sp. IC4-52]|uniref:acyl-CoA thioesterase n=1 Tax=Sphingomonas sp. IC4-52 TaxID=2887202 RepID=UPI001D0FFDBB|nr:acyl-CoA thioesterase [Sphingomonas sp. IC4-52]MCC2981629.1 acyl-CoA thioesterase [Sphingomonas sp. IC4-52]